MRSFLFNFCMASLACCAAGCNRAHDRAEAEYDLGAHAISDGEEPDFTAAFAHFTKATQIDATYIPAYIGRAYVLQKNGQSADAVKEYTRAIKVDPKAGNTFLLRGKLNRALKDYDQSASDLRKAITLFSEAMNEDFRTAAEFESKRREANLQLAIGLFEQDKLDEALAEAENTIALMEGSSVPNPDVYYWRGRIYYEMCHPRDPAKRASADKLPALYEMAIRDFGKAIWDDNENAEIYVRRGWALFEAGNYKMAEADSLDAIAIDKSLSDAYYNLARIYSMASDPAIRKGKEAVQNAGIACNLTKFKSWYCLAAAGAAFAEAGDFAKAERAQQMAIQLAPERERGELKERLALFRKKQPFRYHALDSTARKSAANPLGSPR